MVDRHTRRSDCHAHHQRDLLCDPRRIQCRSRDAQPALRDFRPSSNPLTPTRILVSDDAARRRCALSLASSHVVVRWCQLKVERSGSVTQIEVPGEDFDPESRRSDYRTSLLPWRPGRNPSRAVGMFRFIDSASQGSPGQVARPDSESATWQFAGRCKPLRGSGSR